MSVQLSVDCDGRLEACVKIIGCFWTLVWLPSLLFLDSWTISG